MKELLAFGFPFFLRVIIPGAIGSIALAPLLISAGSKLGFDLAFWNMPLGKAWGVFGLLTVSIGFLLYFLDDVIYRLFEGYGWPKGLSSSFVRRLNKRIAIKTDEARKSKGSAKARRLWTWLRRFPLKEDREKTEVEAVLPTKMGNIIWEYENYPKSRYGIRAIFYWPRIWLALDSETRKELDGVWAAADCLTYISFALYSSAIIDFLTGACDYFNILTWVFGSLGPPLSKISIGNLPFVPSFFAISGVIAFILGYLCYLLSLRFHYKFGQFFKSVFDMHRDRLKPMISSVEIPDSGWERSWNYLQNGQRRCSICSAYFPASLPKCPKCNPKQ